MEPGIFMDKSTAPAGADLREALGAIRKSDTSAKIVTGLEPAKACAEGRGMRIPADEKESLRDIFRFLI